MAVTVYPRQDMDLNYVRTQVKIAKDGFDLCPDTSQNRKIWQLCLMDKFVLYGINFYSCTRYKLLCSYNYSALPMSEHLEMYTYNV